jgi:SulP family sulfate permease
MEVLKADIVAGIAVGAVLIPQSIAYAELAGLPAVYGLYAALLPPVVAAFFGSSRQLSTGPVAIASLISATTIWELAPPDMATYIAYSIMLAALVGVMRLCLGVLRLGILVNLLSGTAIIGFVNAAAVIIATSQLHDVLGVSARTGNFHFETIWYTLLAASHQVHWPTLAMALLSAAIVFLLRRRTWKVLLAVSVTTALSWIAGYEGGIVGALPAGLPTFAIPQLDFTVIPKLAVGAAVMTLIGLVETAAVTKTIATKTRQQLDLNQELVGQGLASLVGSLFQGYAVSSSFFRSALNLSSGAKTGFSSLVTSAVVMLTLLFLTPLFYHLPQATLAVIIMIAVLGLFRMQPAMTAWRVSRRDGVVALVTFLATLAAAPKLHIGILIGITLSLIIYLHGTMRPHIAYLARHPDGPLVDAEANSLAIDQHIALIRFDGQLYYGVSSYFEDKVLEAVTRLPELKYIVIDSGSITRIDATGEQTLLRVVENVRAIGVDVYFTRAKEQFVAVLERAGTMNYIGRDHFFDWNQHALDHLWNQLGPSYQARSPLHMATPTSREGIWAI